MSMENPNGKGGKQNKSEDPYATLDLPDNIESNDSADFWSGGEYRQEQGSEENNEREAEENSDGESNGENREGTSTDTEDQESTDNPENDGNGTEEPSEGEQGGENRENNGDRTREGYQPHGSMIEQYTESRTQRIFRFIRNGGIGETIQNFPQNARQAIEDAYDRGIRLPTERLTAKFLISRSQGEMDKQSRIAERISERIDEVGIDIQSLEQQNRTLTQTIERLREREPAVARDLEREIERNNNQLDALRSRQVRFAEQIQSSNNRIEAFERQRNFVAERMSQRYQEHLRPVEQQQERLEIERTQMELEIQWRIATITERENEISGLENDRRELERIASSRGFMSRSGTSRAIQRIEQRITGLRTQIAQDQNTIEIARANIEERINAVNSRVEPFRLRERELQRVTERSDQTVEVPEIENPEDDFIDDFDESAEFTDDSMHPAGNLVNAWNRFLENEHEPEVFERMRIDPEQFFNTGGQQWNADRALRFNNFLDILHSYYQRRAQQGYDVDEDMVNNSREDFTNESVNENV